MRYVSFPLQKKVVYMKKVRVFVAVHKAAKLYGDDKAYKFIHVGATKSPIIINEAQRDDDADNNISNKNDIYCELTGLYYIWKNVHDVEYVGLCHYRRYPSNDDVGLIPNLNILSEKDIVGRLQHADIILLQKTPKNGEINGYFTDKERLLHYRPYVMMQPVIKELYPEYLDSFEEEFITPTMSFGNIMICRKSLFDNYCKWLFHILFAVEQKMNQQSGPEPRELGFYSEWLLNVWVRHNKLNVDYANVFFTEKFFSFSRLKTYFATRLRKLQGKR